MGGLNLLFGAAGVRNFNRLLPPQAGFSPEVVPLLRYFKQAELPTCMSCQGHNTTNMSVFWIEFDKSVTSEDLIEFQRKHTSKYGGFCSNGQFVIRILANSTGVGTDVEFSYQYTAATIEAAMEDLSHWKNGDGP